jgi:hypothetical protein
MNYELLVFSNVEQNNANCRAQAYQAKNELTSMLRWNMPDLHRIWVTPPEHVTSAHGAAICGYFLIPVPIVTAIQNNPQRQWDLSRRLL